MTIIGNDHADSFGEPLGARRNLTALKNAAASMSIVKRPALSMRQTFRL